MNETFIHAAMHQILLNRLGQHLISCLHVNVNHIIKRLLLIKKQRASLRVLTKMYLSSE